MLIGFGFFCIFWVAFGINIQKDDGIKYDFHFDPTKSIAEDKTKKSQNPQKRNTKAQES